MARDKKSFLLYCDIVHTVNKLTDTKAGELFKFILSYVNDEEPSTDDLIIKLTFEPIKQALKRDLKKYENVCNRNKNNGLKGGRPKNPEEPKKPSGIITNPEEPKKADIDIDIDIESDIDIKKKINKFIIPTILEIKNYCLERKNNVDAEKFFNFYESKGWMVGKNKMKDWKACIRTWESKENNQQNKIKPQDSRINHLQSLLND